MASNGWRPPVPRRQTTTVAAAASGISSRDSPELHFSCQERSTFPLSAPRPPPGPEPTIPAFALASASHHHHAPPHPRAAVTTSQGSRIPAPAPKPYHRPWGEDHIIRVLPPAIPPSPPPVGGGEDRGIHHPRPTRTPSSYRDVIRNLHDAADEEADRTRPASTSPAPAPAPAPAPDDGGSGGFWRPRKEVRFSEQVEVID